MTQEEQNPYAPPKHGSTGFIVIENHDLRAHSRQQLKGAWGKMALAVFVYSLIVYPALFIFSEISPLHNTTLDVILTIAYYIVIGPFYLGFSGLFLKRIRGEEVSVKNIFDGFGNFFKSFLLCLFYVIFTMLWSLLLIVPGIIKALGYSMAYYIMYDNPDIKPLEALKKSQAMMKGYKGKFFMLYLSFIGWALLGLLTLGIGYLWLYPYVGVSMGNFYENLKQNQQANPGGSWQ